MIGLAVLLTLASVSRAQPDPLTAGLEFGSGPGRLALDPGFSLAERSFTVEAWIWLNASFGDRPVLAHLGSENLFHLLVRNNRLHLGFWEDDLTGASDVPTGEWVHVAFAYDHASRAQRVFLNGVLDGERTASTPFTENNLALNIGAYFDPTLNPFDGRMLELRIWDHARSEATLAAERFTTPSMDAPGLEALFTFEGTSGGNVPDVTGALSGNVLSGAVTIVEPVPGPALLGDPNLTAAVPAGSLSPEVADYSLSPLPTAPYTDPTGSLLSDGRLPYRVWGSPWLDNSSVNKGALLAWQLVDPELSFQFSERVRVDAITVYAANSAGAAGFEAPAWVYVDTPGGYAASLPVVIDGDTGSMQAIELSGLGLLTDQLTLTVQRGGEWLALGEVTFHGAPLAQRSATGFGLPLRTQRFFGVSDPAELRFDIVPGVSEVSFRFPRAADTFGVRGTVEWSTDLQDWQPLPDQPAAEPGRRLATLAPVPEEDRAFFRLRLDSDLAGLNQPVPLNLDQTGTPFELPAGTFLGTASDPTGPDGLSIAAINDRATTVGQPIALDFGGSLRIEADGSGTLTVPASMPGGATIDEVFSYTVVNRLGESERRTFSFTINGENDAPSVEPIALNHSSGVVDAGTAYRYFEGDFPTEASLLASTPTATGRQPSFSLAPASTATGGFGLEMTGELFVPASGPYTFYLTGNNTSVLDVGGTRVIAHDDAERSGTVELTAGTHSVRVLYFDTTEPTAELTVDYSGPGFIREPLPASAFPRLTSVSLDPLAGASDPDTGDTLTLSHIDGLPIAFGSPVLLPSGATVELYIDGSLNYTPAPGRAVLHETTASDRFTYSVTDASGLSTTADATIGLARENAAPVANPSYALAVNYLQIAQILAVDAASDADGDPLRITHVNGQPLAGGVVESLPSNARVSLSTDPLSPFPNDLANGPRVPFGLRYDAVQSFLLTLTNTTGTDAFTITVTDSAGASTDLAIAATWPLYDQVLIGYADSRFNGDLPSRTAQLFNHYRFPVEALISVTDRQTGLRYGQSQRTLASGQFADLAFDLPAGIDLEGQHFFDRFDLEVDTLDGVPIFYGFDSGQILLVKLYSSANRSYFRVIGASSPHWPIILETVGKTVPVESGIYIIDTVYGGIAQLFRNGNLIRGASAEKGIIEPSFAANILVTGICRTPNSSRFTVENRTSETVPLTVGSTRALFTFAPGQTQTIEIAYESRAPFLVKDTPLGLFNTNEVTCPLGLDFTATPLCSSSSVAFIQVRNNHPTDSFTVRIESVQIPSIRSAEQEIGNQAEAFIELDPQNINLAGTEGRIMVILPNSEEIAGTFIFSSDSCF